MVLHRIWPDCPEDLRDTKYFSRLDKPINSSEQAWEELAKGIAYAVAGILSIYLSFKLAVQVEQGYQWLSRSFKSAGMSHEGLLVIAFVYSAFQWKSGPNFIGWFGREYIGQVTYPRLANSISYLGSH